MQELEAVQAVIGLLSAATLGSLLTWAIKWVVRKLKKDDDFQFSKSFYVFILPVSQFVAQPLMIALGLLDASFAFDWAYAQSFAQVVLGSLVAVMIYNGAIQPIKDIGK